MGKQRETWKGKEGDQHRRMWGKNGESRFNQTLPSPPPKPLLLLLLLLLPFFLLVSPAWHLIYVLTIVGPGLILAV
jgi:hypothetical protein